MFKTPMVLLLLILTTPALAGRTNVDTGENIPGADSVNTTQGDQQNSTTTDTSLVGRVSSLKIQGLNNPILYFTIDNQAGCTTQPNAYFLTKSDSD
ncbi:MAG: hypothetical protein GXP08_04640, partial [Gammaproteobacteria bacterium]|nr:hypothetical protein [Gammaproteobacteria bacterium]